MKNCNLLVVGLCTLFTLGTHDIKAAHVTAQVPHTAAAQRAADLIGRAQRAIAGYVGACAARDEAGFSKVTTEDVRIDYLLDEPGRYLSTDASSLIADCAPNSKPGESESRIANLWIFPTHDSDAVFVRYDVQVGASATTSNTVLALVEMRGNRISRMLNFAAAPPSLVASAMRLADAAPSCSNEASRMTTQHALIR